MKTVLLAVVLSSCDSSAAERWAAIGIVPGGGIPSDALIDLTTPWVRHTITAGAATGMYRGADGVDLVGGDVVTAWEEGGLITVAHLPADPSSPWPTDVVATGVAGVEDAKLGDIDRDGVADVASASDAGQRVYASFAGTSWTTVDIRASHGHNRWMQVAIADINGDGFPDIVGGTRVGTAANPAVIAWLENPGAAARDGTAWVYHQISLAGWAMSVVPRDVDHDGDIDVVVSDRASYKDPAGVIHWDLYGARWEEQTPSGWVTHAISPPAGSCAGCTPTDEMFLRIVGDDVYDCTSAGTKPNRIALHHNLGGGTSWSTTTIPDVANAGHCQDVVVADLDGDGLTDIAVSSWKGNSLPLAAGDAVKSGVWWLRNRGDGTYQRGEVSGPDGGKFDNLELLIIGGKAHLMTSEQLDPAGGLGVIWYESPF